MAQHRALRPRGFHRQFPHNRLGFGVQHSMNALLVVLGPLLVAQTTEGPFVPPPLPSPPRLAHWLFENPWPPSITLIALAVIVFVLLNARGQAKQGMGIGAGLLAIAAACIGTAFLVTTDRERVAARTVELIGATATADLAALRPLLASDVGLNVLGRPFPEEKEGILGMVGLYMGGSYRVEQHTVSNITAHVDRLGSARTLARVRVEVDGFTNRSWWRITWRKNAQGEWEARHIDGLQIDMVKPSMLPR